MDKEIKKGLEKIRHRTILELLEEKGKVRRSLINVDAFALIQAINLAQYTKEKEKEENECIS